MLYPGLQLAHRAISLLRNNLVALRAKRTADLTGYAYRLTSMVRPFRTA
jgi:hypothetical protein